ncbi:MAG: hypothetical protein ACAI43_23645, partial [Phycisphaerae bacterium]|nr:hypothetical protein [Tepidisphaeraceae bacterium]
MRHLLLRAILNGLAVASVVAGVAVGVYAYVVHPIIGDAEHYLMGGYLEVGGHDGWLRMRLCVPARSSSTVVRLSAPFP